MTKGVTVRRWANTLRLADMYMCTNLRSFAINRLDYIATDPVDRISLGLKFEIHHWVVPAMAALARRTRPPSDEECTQLGLWETVKLFAAREQLAVANAIAVRAIARNKLMAMVVIASSGATGMPNGITTPLTGAPATIPEQPTGMPINFEQTTLPTLRAQMCRRNVVNNTLVPSAQSCPFCDQSFEYFWFFDDRDSYDRFVDDSFVQNSIIHDLFLTAGGAAKSNLGWRNFWGWGRMENVHWVAILLPCLVDFLLPFLCRMIFYQS